MATETANHDTKSNGADKSAAQFKEQAAEAIKENADKVQAAASDAAKQVSAHAEALTKSSMTFVKENPGTALAGAVGLGVLLGLALNRRS